MEKQTKGNSKTIEANNINISYDDVGEGDVPIIFLHGFPFNKSMWKKQFSFLKDNYRLISIDIRSFGESSNNGKNITIDLFADDLVKFMDTLSINKAMLCGLSMGGFIALNVVNRFPEKFVGLILCDTSCIADTKEVREDRYKTIFQIETNGINEFADKFLENIFHKNTLENNKDVVKKIELIIHSNSSQVIMDGLDALAKRSETCSILSSITIPTLIVCGRNDKITPLSQSEFLNRNIKNSKLEIIDNAGHLSNLEQPELFNNHLLNFLISHVPHNKTK